MASKRPSKATFWRQHVAKYRASGQSRADYCRQHGLKLHQLAYHVGVRNKQAPIGESAFAQVVVASPPMPHASTARLLVGGGVAVEFDSGCDPTWVARLVAAVGGRP